MSDKIQKAYYAIIPGNVRYDKELTANAKLLYGEITALCNEKGYCWANNEYFAHLYGVSKVSISKWISQLVNKGYLESEMHYREGTKEILNRYLTIVNAPIKEKLIPSETKVNEGIKEKFNTPIKEKFKDNNTSFNNTNNNTFNNTETVETVFKNYASGALLESLNDFKEFRKEIKAAITLKAAKMLISKLDTLAKDDYEKVKIIEQSIENGYKGFFPLKSMNKSYINKPTQTPQDVMNMDMSYLEGGNG